MATCVLVKSVIENENELPKLSPALALGGGDGKYHHFMQLASNLKRKKESYICYKKYYSFYYKFIIN